MGLIMIKDMLIDENMSEDEKEIIRFGTERIITMIIGVIVVLVSSVFLHETLRAILFIVCILPLRQYAGGFHFNNKYICTIVSVTLLLISLIVMKQMYMSSYVAVGIYMLFSMIIVFLAPVGNTNRELSVNETVVFGNRAKTIWLIETTVFIVLWTAGSYQWYIIMLLSVVITGVLVLLGYVQETIMKQDVR